MAESALQRRTRKTLEKERGGCFYKTHGNMYTVVGQPDLIGTIMGLFFGLEMKMPGEVATPAQLYEIERIKKSGGFAGVFYSVDEVLTFVDKVLKKKGKV